MQEYFLIIFSCLTLIDEQPNFQPFGVGYEEFSEGADVKPPEGYAALREAFYIFIFDKTQRLLNVFFKDCKRLNNQKKGGQIDDENLIRWDNFSISMLGRHFCPGSKSLGTL